MLGQGLAVDHLQLGCSPNSVRTIVSDFKYDGAVNGREVGENKNGQVFEEAHFFLRKTK